MEYLPAGDIVLSRRSRVGKVLEDRVRSTISGFPLGIPQRYPVVFQIERETRSIFKPALRRNSVKI